MQVAGQIGDEVVQRHRPLRMVDRHDGPMDDRDPVGDLLDVGDGGREPHQQHVVRRRHDDLLPDGAAALVPHVVALVQHDVLEVLEPAAVERVAEDLGGHHQDLRLWIHLHVTGEDADPILAVGAREVAELLVAQRLERRGVGDALPGLERGLDGELGDERLAGAGRRRHDHRLVAGDRADRLHLEVVQRKGIAGAEALEHVHPSTLSRGSETAAAGAARGAGHLRVA